MHIHTHTHTHIHTYTHTHIHIHTHTHTHTHILNQNITLPIPLDAWTRPLTHLDNLWGTLLLVTHTTFAVHHFLGSYLGLSAVGFQVLCLSEVGMRTQHPELLTYICFSLMNGGVPSHTKGLIEERHTRMAYLPGIPLPQVLQITPEHLPQEEEFILLPLGIPPSTHAHCTQGRGSSSVEWLSQCTVSDSPTYKHVHACRSHDGPVRLPPDITYTQTAPHTAHTATSTAHTPHYLAKGQLSIRATASCLVN